MVDIFVNVTYYIIKFSNIQLKGGSFVDLSDRQKQIIDIVKEFGPISGEQIADQLGLSRATLRPDLSVLSLTKMLIAKPKVGYIYNKNYVTPFVISEISQKKVAEVMSIPVIIKQETSIQEAINQIFLEDVGSLYITENNQLVGIVSRKDLLKATLAGNKLDDIPVSVVMTRMPNIITINHDNTVNEATHKLIMHKIDSLPVLKETAEKSFPQIVGKFSKTVTTRLLLQVLENEI